MMSDLGTRDARSPQQPPFNRPLIVHVTTVPQSLWFLKGYNATLRSHGMDMAVVSSPGVHLKNFCDAENVAGHAIPMARAITPCADLQSLARLILLFRKLHPEVVHAHTPKAGLLATLAARVARVPAIIYHLHGLPLETARGLRRHLLSVSEWVAMHTAHQVLGVSKSVADAAARHGLCRCDRIAVPAHGSINGIDATHAFNPERLPPQTSLRIRTQHGIPQSAVVMGFVGRLVPDKGVGELAAAWAPLREQYPDLHLLLVGDREPTAPLPLSVVRVLENDPRIHYVGYEWDVSPYYTAMDFLVLPTYREGFPVVCLEAAAMRLPVVATRVTGCVDAIDDGSTGILVARGDAAALATAIALYVENPSLRSTHGASARSRVLERYSPHLLQEAIVTHYTALLERAGWRP